MIAMRYWSTVPLAAIAALLGCDSTGPALETRLYRLHSVNGQPLPFVLPPSLGFAENITHGELLLRADRSFQWGLGATLGGSTSGEYQASGSAFTLTSAPPGSISVEGSFAGDSAIVAVPGSTQSGDVPALPGSTPAFRYLFVRREPAPGPVSAGTYALTRLGSVSTVQGAWVVHDTVVGSTRYVTRAADTIRFTDGVFFTRAYALEDSVIFGDTRLARAEEYLLSGSYTGSSAHLLLRRHNTSSGISMSLRDSLMIQGDKLVRPNVIPLAEYTRVR